MVRLSSTANVLAALRTARRVEAQAYTLHGPVLRALEDAAGRGADVHVRLASQPYADPGGRLAAENRRLVRELRAAGAHASVAQRVHAKVIAADGQVYLDGCNWGAGDLVLRDDARDAARIPMHKCEALAAEAGLLAARERAPIVESESFGERNGVYSALRAAALRGLHPRLLVSARDLRGNAKERAALEALAHDGVRVRTCDNSEKLALVGARAWIGSANATSAFGAADDTDWGLCTANRAIVAAVRARLQARWSAARPLSL